MYITLIITGNNISYSELDGTLKDLIKTGTIYEIAAPFSFLENVNHENLTCLIDYPYGVGTTDIRLKEIEQAASKVKNVNVVINPSHCTSRLTEKIYNDYVECHALAKKLMLNCVPIIEYRFIPISFLVELVNILKQAGANRIILGTGTTGNNDLDLYDICKKVPKDIGISISGDFMEEKTLKKLNEVGVSNLRQSIFQFVH